MARQSTTPVSFSPSIRQERGVTMSSARAGVVVPVGYFPVLPGDSVSGRMAIDGQLGEMPKPLLNGVTANVQAWLVPKSAFPQFSGRDELAHAMTGEAIKTLGAADRTPPPFYDVVDGVALTTAAASDFFTTLGIHIPAGESINSDLIDAFNLVYNFRLAAISSRLPRRAYASEDIAEATTLPPAFWPSARRINMVPDYERALLLGTFDLDVAAGSLSLSGEMMRPVTVNPLKKTAGRYRFNSSDAVITVNADANFSTSGGLQTHTGVPVYFSPDGSLEVDIGGLVVENTNGAGIPVTLAGVDKGRTTQAFAELRTAYAGNDATGFDNDDTLVALLMQGIAVPADQFKRPILLDSKRVPVGFAERFATDAANLDASVTQGRFSASLSLNVPRTDVGGVVVFTVEVLPERIDERQADYWLGCTSFNDLPNALRDIQRVEPVDLVLNKRLDAKHTTPGGLYAYEPMNDVWNRDFTRLGGVFYQATPGAGWTENRANIWQTEIIDPEFSATHYLAPEDFPHDVFSDTLADAFEYVCRHDCRVVGLTQIGDVLAENSDDYAAIAASGVGA